MTNERVGVRLQELRTLVEFETTLSGNNLSNEIKSLIKEGLRVRYRKRTLADILAAYDFSFLAKASGLSVERLGELACELSPPTCGEVVRLASVMPVTPKELAELSNLKPVSFEKKSITTFRTE